MRLQAFLTCLMLGSFLFTASCATTGQKNPVQPEKAGQTAPDRPQKISGESGRKVDLPPEVESALIPDIPFRSSKPEPQQQTRLNITANNVPAREFFMSLAQDSDFNMTVHPEVQGAITLRLKDVTVPEILNIVHNVYGYPFERSRSGFQVMPIGMQTRIFQIDYLNLKRSGESQTRVSSGQVSESNLENDDSGSGSRSTVTGTSIKTNSESDFWTELRVALETIVGSQGGRKVIVQPQAGLVVVRALPLELKEIARYLESMQSNIQRQVILEAKILEVTLDSGFQTGINWSTLLDPSDDAQGVLTQTGGGTVFDTGLSNTAGEEVDISPVDPDLLAANMASAFGGVFSAAISIDDFTAFIELLESQGDVQVLSSPRISTLNNQKAVIKVGQDDFFVTDISSETIVGGDATTTSPDVSLTPFFSGIALDVTPHITPDSTVTLHIHPTVSEVTEETKNLSISGTTQTLPLASSSVRESDSVVRARSGQVVVIGGLMQNKTEDRSAQVPVLGDLPVVGKLFQQTRKSSQKSELVILLRPEVTPFGQVWTSGHSPSPESFQSNTWPAWWGDRVQ